LAFSNRLDGFVDGDALVVARLLAAGIVEIVLKDDGFLGISDALPCLVFAQSASGEGNALNGRLCSTESLWPVLS